MAQMARKQPPLIRMKRFQLAPKSCAASPHPFMFQYPQNPANTPLLICFVVPSSPYLSGIALFCPLLSEIRPGLSEAARSSPLQSVSVRF